MRLGTLFVASVLVIAWHGTARAEGKETKPGKIDKTRKRLDSEKKSKDRDHRSSGEDNSYDDDDCGDFDDDCDDIDSLAGILASYVITAPYWAPAAMVGDWPVGRHRRRFRFRTYPYADASAGPHDIVPRDQLRRGVTAPFEASLRLLASYEVDEKNLDARRIRATVRSNWRLNFDTELTRYTEDLGADTDTMWHYKAMLGYSFAVSPRTHMSSSIGLRWIRFAAGDHYVGFNFRYAMEFFPARPVHMWLSGEVGGGDGTASEAEAGIGLLLNRFEVFAGWRGFRVVGVSFAGPQAGVLAWF